LQELLSEKSEENVEAFCQLLSNVGLVLEGSPRGTGKQALDEYAKRLEALARDSSLASR
jgi:hypothetical protein